MKSARRAYTIQDRERPEVHQTLHCGPGQYDLVGFMANTTLSRERAAQALRIWHRSTLHNDGRYVLTRHPVCCYVCRRPDGPGMTMDFNSARQVWYCMTCYVKDPKIAR